MLNIKLTHTFQAAIGLDKYPIIIGINIFRDLIAFLKTYSKNIFIICDKYFKTNNHFYSDSLSFIFQYNHIFIDGGIESKTIRSYENILKELVRKNIARDGVIVAIGGGVIGDLGAFAASTYQRGIDLVHIPTTTTAMIDSSVGGKTGLNHLEQVNLIGSYHNPKGSSWIYAPCYLKIGTTIPVSEAIKMSITQIVKCFINS